VCSSHPTVIEAAVRQAAEDGSGALIEATSNQVDQFGGYSGLTPDGFRDAVWQIAGRHGLDRSRVTLGGDHLGPNRWTDQTPEEAMDLAQTLVERYVIAGYTKIHLDCSMGCAGDPTPLGDETVASRAARLIGAAEAAAAGLGDGARRLFYVIGTEVPVPGGAHHELDTLAPTSPDAAKATIAAHRAALGRAGLDEAWTRVGALVVQPGVEFSQTRVVDYDPSRTAALARVLDDEPGMVFEAHSTDYQTPDRLADLVRDGWAILKVGPGLTFAMREALTALSLIEAEVVPHARRARLMEAVDAEMLARPAQWAGYYGGRPAARRLARAFSYSDRVRYYWPAERVREAEERLYEGLAHYGLPLPLVSQFLPRQYDRIRAGELSPDPRELVVDKVRDVLRLYSRACAPLD
jgi:D-tagatose-1,6-bisphosphate aldolase subunit GatZ/KbaZ